MPCTFSWLANLYFHFRLAGQNKSIWRLSVITWDQITCKVKDLSTAFCETQPPASFGWVALSSVFVCRPASVTSPPISTIWRFRAYKSYIFCEDMILATCQCQHIFCCWVEPSLLLSSLYLHWIYVANNLGNECQLNIYLQPIQMVPSGKI